MKKISFEEAVSRGLTRYFTGIPCKYGHIDERYTINQICCECNRLKMKERYKQFKELLLANREKND